MRDTIWDTQDMITVGNSEASVIPVSLAPRIAVTDICVPGLRGSYWRWLRAHNTAGHARVKINGKVKYVHREVLKCEGVELTNNDHVVSLCRFPGCVNPDHHVAGTEEDARAFTGKSPRIGIGDLVFAKELVDSGKASIEFTAYAYGVTRRLIDSGIAKCAFEHIDPRHAGEHE